MHDVWLDTDPGFDDWMAWALLEADPALRLHGVGVVAGNAPLPATLDNALRIRALHRWRTPVHAGCDRPLARPPISGERHLGRGALATLARRLPPARAEPAPGHAADALVDVARRLDGRLVVVAIGPLTNLAAALQREPALPRLVRSLVLMGGSTDRGCRHAAREFNVCADPEAAERVFGAGFDITMFGRNVCRQVAFGAPQAAAIRHLPGERAQVFADHLEASIRIGRARGRNGMTLCDPAPALWLARPALFALRPARVQVELGDARIRGRTVCDFTAAAPNARVGVTVRGGEALAFAVERLARALVAV